MIYNFIDTSGDFCRGNKRQINDARMSFPSGHSSIGWYTMTFLILYLQARLRMPKYTFIKALIQMCAFIAAYITCIR